MSDFADLSTAAKLEQVRSLMAKQGIDALLVPTDDPHMSEYTATYFSRREFISSFTGSAGVVVITSAKALLFTDGRYHKQAEMELSTDWTLMKVGLEGVQTYEEYLMTEFKSGSVVGIDPLVHAASTFAGIEKKLQDKGIIVKAVVEHPVDAVWGSRRPAKPNSQLRQHPLEYAGKSSIDKMAEIRAQLKQHGARALLVTALDEVAWLYNFRASDVECNPVSVCYAVLGTEDAHLFIDAGKVNAEMQRYFADCGVQLRPYEDIVSFVSQLAATAAAAAPSEKIWVDGKTVNWGLYSCVPAGTRLEKESPIVDMKACKNAAELQGMRNCHLRDGAAVVEFMCWLEEAMAVGQQGITEVDIDLKVTECRAQQALYVERSFPSIAGVNENGAIMHYRAVPGTCKTLTANDLLLLDSGGQYLDGTTDVTRTFHMGSPSDYQREMFTRVLKGNIALDSKIFPTGTAGCLLDGLARQFLWEVGKNYLHGTGHGVGAALNVHEGPHRISPLLDPHPLKPGMIVSNEPGYYEDGNFGIRLENLLEVVALPKLGQFGGRGFMGFKRLTHIPFQKKMLKLELLSDNELDWINSYHKEVREKVGPLLKSDRSSAWLDCATSPLTR